MNDEIHAFVDTNVFLHFKPLADIDWCGFLNARPVRLVVCLPVVQELDEKKCDPRMADRARRAIKEIESHETTSTPLRPGVTLEIYNEELRRDEFPSSLSPDSEDDRIVHLARKYMESNADIDVCVITDDYGMALRCRVNGVASRRMRDSDRLENPTDEKDRKIKQLQSDLASLQSRLPRLTVRAFTDNRDIGDEAPCVCTLAASWVKLDPKAEVEKQRMEQEERKNTASRSPVGPRLLGALVVPQIGEDRWQRFDHAVSDYLIKYENYMKQLNTYNDVASRTISFRLLLVNDGSGPATDVDVQLFFPRGFLWIGASRDHEALHAHGPQAPSPPELPRRIAFPDVDFQIPQSMLRRSLQHRHFSPSEPFDARPITDRREPNLTVRLGAGGEHLVHVRIDRLKHHFMKLIGSFRAVFDPSTKVRPFEIEYAITASEHPGRITGKLPMIVRRADQDKQPTDTHGSEAEFNPGA